MFSYILTLNNLKNQQYTIPKFSNFQLHTSEKVGFSRMD